MKKHLTLGWILLLLVSHSMSAQIDFLKSSSQVVAYWQIGQKQEYQCKFKIYEIAEADTIVELSVSYDAVLTIVDSTASNYTLEWYTNNYSVESTDELRAKISKVLDGFKVVFKTDELGVFEEVVNWEALQERVKQEASKLSAGMSDNAVAPLFLQRLQQAAQSRSAISNNLIRDIIQYLYFHGVAYDLDKPYYSLSKTPAAVGEEGFDTEMIFWLDDIYLDGNYAIYRMVEDINSEQLTNYTYNYLKENDILGEELPSREEFPALSNRVETDSVIDGEGGWIIFSHQLKTVKSLDKIQCQEREITIK